MLKFHKLSKIKDRWTVILTLSLTLFSLGMNSCARISYLIQPTPEIHDKDLSVLIAEQSKRLEENEEDTVANYLLARAYFLQKAYNTAEPFARRAVQLAPLNGVYSELLGDLAFRTERFGVALNAYNTAVKVQADLLSAYLKLALTYEKINDTERAIVTLEETVQRDNRYVEALYHLARLDLKQRDYQGAQQAIKVAANLEPNNQEILLLKIQINSAMGNYYNAKILVKKEIEKAPQEYIWWHELLKIHFSQQQWTESLALIEQMREKNMIKKDDLLLQSHIYLSTQRLDESRPILKDLLDKDPQNIEAMMELAVLHMHDADYDQAMHWLQNALEINNRISQAHFLQANLFYQQGNLLQGDLSINRALELDPQNINYQLLQLRRQMMKGEFNVVEEKLKDMLKKYPLESNIMRLQADLLVLKNQYSKAETILAQIQLVQPSDIVQLSLARVYYFREQYRSILPITSELMKRFPKDWENIYLHASALNRLQQTDQALKLLEPYVTKKVGEGFLHLKIGDLYRYLGNDARARQVYQQGLDLYPNQPYLIDGLSSLMIASGELDAVSELLYLAIEQHSPLESILIDRLVNIHLRKGSKAQLVQLLQRYHNVTDPILNSQNFQPEKRLLFPIASPAMGFAELAIPLLSNYQ